MDAAQAPRPPLLSSGSCAVWALRSSGPASFGPCVVWALRPYCPAQSGPCAVWVLRLKKVLRL